MQTDYKKLKCMDRKDHFEQHGLIPISSKNEITASNSAVQQILVLSCPCQALVSTMSVCFSTTPTSTPHSILWHKPTSKIHQTSCRIERELCIFFSIWKTGAVPSTTWGHYDKKIESHHHYFIFLDFQPSNTQKKMKNQTNISKSLTGLGLKLPDPPSHSHFFGRSISGHKNWLEAMHHLTLHRPCRRQVTPLLDGNAALLGT